MNKDWSWVDDDTRGSHSMYIYLLKKGAQVQGVERIDEHQFVVQLGWAPRPGVWGALATAIKIELLLCPRDFIA